MAGRPATARRIDDPLGQTVPSFDITKLFNGFRPVFQTLDAAQLNQFGENLLRLIQGDDTGIGPVLRDLDTISKYAVNRQAVITLLLHNLSDLSGISAASRSNCSTSSTRSTTRWRLSRRRPRSSAPRSILNCR